MIDHQQQPLEVLQQVILIARQRHRMWWVAGCAAMIALGGGLTTSAEPVRMMLCIAAALITTHGATQAALNAEIAEDCRTEIERRSNSNAPEEGENG